MAYPTRHSSTTSMLLLATELLLDLHCFPKNKTNLFPVTGHVRLGWCTNKAELQAPVGFDAHGYSYRDLEGSKVHQGLREPYGSAFKEGDVVGVFLHKITV